MKQLFVYILQCSDNSYYTGVTNDVELRLEQHNYGADSRAYTYKRRPVKLVYVEEFWEPIQAIFFEKQIKGWSRSKKEALIENNIEKLKSLAVCKNNTGSKNKRHFDSAQGDGSFYSAQGDYSFDSNKE